MGDDLKYKYVIWDWNGTLLDDVSASLASVNDMLKERNMAPIDINEYKEYIDVPIIGFYEKVFDLENEDYDEILKQYNSGYLYHLKDCNIAEGAKKLLENFKNEGTLQIIVSSSNNNQLKMNVEKYGLTEYFDAILGSENYLAESKIQRAIDYINNHGEGKALVIGDLVHDYEMALELGADCILTRKGHEKPERLDNCKCRVVENLSETGDIYD